MSRPSICVVCCKTTTDFLECGHSMHSRCYGRFQRCVSCGIEAELRGADAAAMWQFILFVNSERPEIIERVFENDVPAYIAWLRVITGAAPTTCRELFAIDGTAHPLLFAIVSGVYEHVPDLVDRFCVSAADAYGTEGAMFCSIVHMVRHHMFGL